MKKTILIFLIVILSTTSTFSQDYFIADNDTTYCQDLAYSTTSQGYLKKMSYESLDGSLVKYEKRKKCPNVTTFHIKDKTIDRIPLKASKPNSYVRFISRAVNGKIKTYSNASSKAYSYSIGEEVMGEYHYTIQMPDGKFYDIRKKKNMKKYIIPYLLECKEFKNQYKGEFKTAEPLFNKTIELYNSLCQ
ncbi:hypothetical protein ERX46_12015 [Brumimicrobium glaciale]|uniref:Uncharacterized protein n=1 Tax=Brumimicrobium glaciale TaxID=200475 RepID=A0A4Q4KHN1_9FLAO|nr:hypothetical protein [Brumimicrobium glaciale]RYM32783.1 hypothetical protein ERX46_12015 [Brumimicrobium glaciale]